MNRITKQRFLFLFLTIVLILNLSSRFALLKEDALEFYPDEARYSKLEAGMTHSFVSRDIMPYLRMTLSIHGRPGYGILYFLPTVLIEILSKPIIGQIFNLVLASGSIILIYLIIKIIESRLSAFLSALFFAFSMSSITYMRHMLPYDGSLFVFLLGIYILLKTKSLFILGIMLGFSLATYPGIYYYILPIPFLIFFSSENFNLYNSIVGILKFLLGFFLVILGFEIFSRTIGLPESFITQALDLSTTITQGDFMPTFVFFSKYALANDGIFGIFLIALGIITFFKILIFDRHKIDRKLICLYTLVTYLFLEYFSFISHKTVLYGRTIRMYYLLFMILAAIGIINFFDYLAKKNSLKYRRGITLLAVYGLLISAILINWYPRYLTYKNLMYPQEFIKLAKKVSFNQEKLSSDIIIPIKNSPDDQTVSQKLLPDTYYFVNTDFLYPYYGTKKVDCKQEIIMEYPYAFSLYKPYGFEGNNELMRKSFESNPPQYKLIYCRS